MNGNWCDTKGMDELQTKTREYAALQLGSQLLQLCELQARIESLTAQLAAVTKERDDLKAVKPE